jgi:hypothetical protein
VTCQCGKTISAPTWREIAALEQREESAAHAPLRSGWGGSQRLTLIGSVLLVIGVALAAIVYGKWPHDPRAPRTPEAIQNAIDSMGPMDTVILFRQMMALGLTADPKDRIQQAYQAELDRDRAWMVFCIVLTAIGAALLATGVTLARRAKHADSVGDA